MTYIEVTEHALRRYRQRVDCYATREQVEALVANARFVTDWAGHNGARLRDGFLVAGSVAFPVVREEDTLVALTCLPKTKKPKADRRAFLEQAREEPWAA